MPEVTPRLGKKHAVPQHIAAFEFKLIGDLTLKQFLYAGVGIAVAYAAWISDLNFFVKWATIIISAGLGLGTAFFPIQDRTLDQWILNFIVAIFSPTQRIWRKEPLPPEYLREDYSQFLTSQVLSMTPLQSRRKLQQYLEVFAEERTASEREEQEFIEKLNFDLPLPTAVEVKPEPEIKPPVEPKKKELPERKELPPRPKLASEISIARKPAYKVPTEKETRYVTTLKNITPGRKVRLPTIEGTIRLKPSEVKPLPERKIPTPTVKELVKEVKEKPQIPQKPLPAEALAKVGQPRIQELERQNRELKARLEQAEAQLKSLMELRKELYAKSEAYRTRLLEQEGLVQKLTERQKAAEREISEIKGVPPKPKVVPPMPLKEKGIPNVVRGVVKDSQGKLLENAVVIVKDGDGDPVRALKTNELGRFTISTPLENGDYTAEVSSKGRHFDIIEIRAEGKPLPPLEFREKYG